VAVHPDPASDSPLSSRAGSPDPPRVLPRVHMDTNDHGGGSLDPPLKIHGNEDAESAVELSSLDLKHTPQRKTSRMVGGGGVGMPYETNSYSSSQQDRVLNESVENRHYGPKLVPPEENDSDEDRKTRAYGQQLMIPAGDRYIAVRTSSMDEREQSNSKLKIHLSDDENDQDHHYRVNHG